MNFDDEGADYYNTPLPEDEWEDWIDGVDDCVNDAVLPTFDGSPGFRTGEVIDLLCDRRLTFLDLAAAFGVHIISEGKYR